MIRLFHATRKYTEVLTPRVPRTVIAGEDSITERICLAESPRHCMHAAGWALKYYDEWENRRGFFNDDFYVLEFHISEDHINKLKSPIYLEKNKLVPDAIETKEWWITDIKELRANKIYIVKGNTLELTLKPLCSHQYIGVDILKCEPNLIYELESYSNVIA